MKIKDGVDLTGLESGMILACQLIDRIFTDAGYECWATSGRDGEHHGRPVGRDDRDPHYLGKAVDFRLWHVPAEKRLAIVDRIRLELGQEYVVLWESKGGQNEHLHVQHGRVVG